MSLSWINQINTPTEWAQAQLAYMHLPVTQSNIDFLVSWAAREGGNWENTANYNPLNTTQREAGSSVMGGGNTAGVQSYQDWSQGLQATAATLANYGQIMSALQGGNALAGAESGAMSTDLSRWSGGGYTTIGNNSSYGSTTGGPSNPSGAAGSSTGGGTITGGIDPNTGQPLTMADTSGIQAYIQQNYPEDAWMLGIPEVAAVLDQAAVKGLGAADVTALIQATTWWKTTTAAMRTFDQTMATDPADYDFSKPGSQAQQMAAHVTQIAATNGATLPNSTYTNTIAIEALKYGWSDAQIQAKIGTEVYVGGANGAQSDAGAVVQALQSQAGQYLMNPNDPVLQSWAQNIVGGTQTMAQFDAYLKQWASTKWSGMAGQINQGYTPQQITNSLRSDVAQTLQIDPSQVDFINDPNFGKILDYVPPGSTTGVHQIMTNSEAQQYIKSTPALGFQNTQNARDDAASLEQAITQNFGKVAS